jgi:DNA-binding response OmpR family regulator
MIGWYSRLPDSNGDVLFVANPRKTILVLDDDASTHRLLASVLSDKDWNVQTAKDAADALSQIQMNRFDLVLTGLKTSGEEDVDLLRQIRRTRPHVKLIVLTSQNTAAAVIDAIREHAFSYFSKPISPEGVKDMVEHALETPAWDDGIEVLSARPEWISVRLKCRMLTADRLLRFLRELGTDLPSREREDIATAFREMLLNALEHGGRFDPAKTVDVSRLKTSQIILYQIHDPGEGFSPESLPHAAISNPPGAPFDHATYRSEHGMRPGGFGILLAKGLVDELIFSERGNEVVLIKYLNPRQG